MHFLLIELLAINQAIKQPLLLTISTNILANSLPLSAPKILTVNSEIPLPVTSCCWWMAVSRGTAGLPCVTVATGPSLPHPSNTAVVFKAQGCRSRPRDMHNRLNAVFVSLQVDRKVCLLAKHLDTEAENPIL